MHSLKMNKISRKEFLELSEKDIMFITNPGRMGDEDGSTFIIKNNNEFMVYRVSGWMYRSEKDNNENYISFEDALNQFPKWHEIWDNWNDENYHGKYKYYYMGFGNGLSVDNSINNEFSPYLDKAVKKYLEKFSEEERKDRQYSAIINVWEDAFMQMANDKQYVIK